MKIAVYASARNEERNVDAWLASTEGADVVAINDTGSTDQTVQKFTHAKTDAMLQVSQLPVEPMTLSNALNIVLDALPADIDLAIRLDLDERLQPGWRTELERQIINGPTVFQPWFDHRGCIYRHDRIHSRYGFRWDLPVHEVLVSDGPYVRYPVDITIQHHQDLTKDRSQVLGELQDALAADPTNARMLHYLAREHTYRNEWQAAIPLLRAHVLTDTFPEERSESWRLLGDAYRALMDIEDVPRRPYANAVKTCPERREGWVALADLHMQQGSWFDCRYAAEHALAITERSWYFSYPFAWGPKPYDLAALASWYLGDKQKAREYGRLALALAPDDERLIDNLRFYEELDPALV